MKLATRTATEADRNLLFEINTQALRDHVERQFGRYEIDDQRRSFFREWRPEDHELILNDHGTVVGQFLVERGAERITLHRLCVLPEFQGCGVGTSVIRRFIVEAGKSDRPLELQVFRTNRAQELYLRLGFEIVAETESHLEMGWRNDVGSDG